MDDAMKQQLSAWLTQGFDASLDGLEVIAAAEGRATARLAVRPPVQNMGGSLHGGAIATLVDDVGTMAILTGDASHRAGVTTDLNVSYLSAAKGGGAVIAEATLLKAGRTLAFVSVDIRREEDGVLVAQGRMTKHLGS